MNVFTITMTTLAAAAIGFAGNASASGTSVDSAVDTIQSLEASGYNVQINGSENVPLSECRVIGVHGLQHSTLQGLWGSLAGGYCNSWM